MTTQKSAERAPEVRTAAGIVRGCWRAGSAAFLGIPFAEPPVGELHFAAPVPHRPWGGVRAATEYGPTPQRQALSEITLIPEPSIPGESTLLVNVFTPSPEPVAVGGLPVLVYVHGGGFVAGSPASPWYDGKAFNRDGIVTVSVSYRLGFQGFGWIADAPHNRGVLDWLLALEWVQHNIRAFGGDPTRVTIAGQSAGGTAVTTLLTMPRAQHLFSQVYCISGAPRDVSLDRAERLGRRLADLAGVEPTRAGLSTLTELQVLELQTALAAPIGSSDDPLAGLLGTVTEGLTLCPVTDGDLLALDTIEALSAGVGADKPLVLGATDHEFNMALADSREMLARRPVVEILGLTGADAGVQAAYLADHPGVDTAGLVGQYITDAVFRAGVVRVAAARGAARTWVYRFSWRSPVTGEAMHCIDVPFFFDCLDADRVPAITGPNAPQQLADDVHGAAVTFIRTGDPLWPQWSPAEQVARVFDLPSTDLADGYRDVQSLLPRETHRR